MPSLGEADRRHMLIEADAGSGVTAAPLCTCKDHNFRICRPFGIAAQDLQTVVQRVTANLGKHYDLANLVDLALLSLPALLNPFKRRTIQACLGGCTQYQVICAGMIAHAFQSVGYPIVPGIQDGDGENVPAIHNPYGAKLIMRHYSQIVPRDVDLGPNFEIVKYNIIGLSAFDYQTIWADKPNHPMGIRP